MRSVVVVVAGKFAEDGRQLTLVKDDHVVEQLARARAFYSEKLGLEPVEENPGGLLYKLGATRFLLYPSRFSASGEHTQATFDVRDIKSVVHRLQERGVRFEEYDWPGLKTVEGIATTGPHKSAWFKDSEGNLLAIMENG